MEVVDEAHDYSVLDCAPLTLSLLTVPERVARNVVVTVPPSRRDQVPVKVAFLLTALRTCGPFSPSWEAMSTPRESNGSSEAMSDAMPSTPKAT
jgi:hypothetical protein